MIAALLFYLPTQATTMLTIDFETHMCDHIYTSAKKKTTCKTFEGMVETVIKFILTNTGRLPNELFNICNLGGDYDSCDGVHSINNTAALSKELNKRAGIIEGGQRIYITIVSGGLSLHEIRIYNSEVIKQKRERIIKHYGRICNCGDDECEHDCGELRCGCIEYCECRYDRDDYRYQ